MRMILRNWLENEQHQFENHYGQWSETEANKALILQRVRFANGLSHLLHKVHQHNLASTFEEFRKICTLDNFVVRRSTSFSSTRAADDAFNDIIGLDMIWPRISARFLGPLNSNVVVEGVEAISKTIQQTGNRHVEQDERDCCHVLGLLLQDVFLHKFSSIDSELRRISLSDASDDCEEPARKKNSTGSNFNVPDGASGTSVSSLLELGFPSSVHMLVTDLVGGRSGINTSNCSYGSIESACNDIRQMILEPDRFLFDQRIAIGQSGNGSVTLQFKKEKIYGRENERDIITNSFHRVSAGANEALLIGGYSGSGKTRLIESVTDQIEAAGGFVVKQKLDLMESEPFSAILATFNDLCDVLRNQICPTDLPSLVSKLMAEFHSDFFLLGQLLPKIYTLSPQLSMYAQVQTGPQMNLNSINFILQRFMRIVSTVSYAVMFILDDLQWADSTSLEPIQAVLSDERGSNFFFVGSYRNNEVDPDHVIFDFVERLGICHVPTRKLTLDGLHRLDLNSMISDALCMNQHSCQPLSAIVFQKTQGNPLFVEQFMQSLVGRYLLQYSFREKIWIWDIGSISSEDMADGVLSILTLKIGSLESGVQSALKALSCFGIKTNVLVVQRLSSTPQYSNLLQFLNQAVDDGFLTFNGTEYMFAHDAVREAAHNIIPSYERDLYHFELATLLYSASINEDLDGVLFLVCDQFRKVQYLLKKEDSMVDLFVRAGTKAFGQSEFPRARCYLVIAECLLPLNYWSTHYDHCLHLFYLRAKVSQCCGIWEETRKALEEIVMKGRYLKDKLNAYFLFAQILLDHNEGDGAYDIGSKVLSKIHEEVPNKIEPHEVLKLVKETSDLLSRMSDDELLTSKEADSKFRDILKFYGLLCEISFVVKQQVLPYFVCKLIQISIEHGFAEYSVVGLSSFAAVLCFDMRLKNIPLARRIGRLAMSLKARFNFKELIPFLHATHHGFVGPYCEPLQSCSAMHQSAFSLGLSIGDTTIALYNPHFYFRSALLSGEPLSKLLQEIDYQEKLACKFGHSHSKAVLGQFRETCVALVTDEHVLSGTECLSQSPIAKINHNFHVAVQSFWRRCQEKFETSCRNFTDMSGVPVRNLFNLHTVLFFHGINLLQHDRINNIEKKISTVEGYVKEFKLLSEYSSWNFNNKYRLLEAEVHNIKGRHEEAKSSYAAAIEASQQSKFVHEEGLAWELAGCHCVNLDEDEEALAHFSKAKKCYSTWGSNYKVEFIERLIEKVTNL